MVTLQFDAFGLNAWRFVSGIGLGLERATTVSTSVGYATILALAAPVGP